MILLVTIEKWENIEGYEGLYQVSNLGKIKSISRFRSNGNGGYVTKEKILKQSKTTTGYYKVELSNNKNKKSLRVHRLVAKAFILNPENKPSINHIDGNPLNNNVTNLEWCTQRENVIHAVETGLKSKHYIPKDELRELYINKRKTIEEISFIYGVSSATIAIRLEEYDIKTRNASESKIKYSLTKEIILKELETKSQTLLANEIGCSQSLISRYLKNIKESGRLYE